MKTSNRMRRSKHFWSGSLKKERIKPFVMRLVVRFQFIMAGQRGISSRCGRWKYSSRGLIEAVTRYGLAAARRELDLGRRSIEPSRCPQRGRELTAIHPVSRKVER